MFFHIITKKKFEQVNISDIKEQAVVKDLLKQWQEKVPYENIANFAITVVDIDTVLGWDEVTDYESIQNLDYQLQIGRSNNALVIIQYEDILQIEAIKNEKLKASIYGNTRDLDEVLGEQISISV